MPLDALRRRWVSLSSWERLALVCWAGVILVVCCRTAIRPRAHSLFPIFDAAAGSWLTGEDAYAPRPDLDVYRYSPTVTVLFVPFHLLGERLGGVAWRLVSGAVLAAALAGMAKALARNPADANDNRRRRALLFLLVLPLAVGNLNNGQSNLLVLGLLVAAVTAAARDRWTLAAVSVAVACLFKVYPVSVGLLLAVLYPRRFSFRFAAALAVGLLLPFLFQRPAYVAGQYLSWLEHLRHDDRTLLPLDLWYRDFRLLCRVWWRPLSPAGYLAVQLGAAAFIARLCLAGQRAGWPRRRLLALLLALACCWMTALGPAAESSTYVLLAPGLVWWMLEARRYRLARAALGSAYGLLILTHVAAWFPFGRLVHGYGPHPVAGLLCLAALAGMSLRALARPEPAAEEPAPPTAARAA